MINVAVNLSQSSIPLVAFWETSSKLISNGELSSFRKNMIKIRNLLSQNIREESIVYTVNQSCLIQFNVLDFMFYIMNNVYSDIWHSIGKKDILVGLSQGRLCKSRRLVVSEQITPDNFDTWVQIFGRTIYSCVNCKFWENGQKNHIFIWFQYWIGISFAGIAGMDSDTLSNLLRRLEGDTCHQIGMWCIIMPHKKRLHQAHVLYYVHTLSPIKMIWLQNYQEVLF